MSRVILLVGIYVYLVCMPMYAKADQPLWPITRAWNLAEEELYTNWVLTQSFETFKNTGIELRKGVSAVLLRWIFARERQLPAAIHLGLDGELFGSWQSKDEWDQLPTNEKWQDDERFKAALKFIAQNFSAENFNKSLYPVRIDDSLFVLGGIKISEYSGSRDSVFITIGHANNSGYCQEGPECLLGYYDYYDKNYMTLTSMNLYQPPYYMFGYKRVRWPEINSNGEWSLRNAELMPGYSLEQYQMDIFSFLDALAKSFRIWKTPFFRAKGIVNSLQYYIVHRMDLVHSGYIACLVTDCSPGSVGYKKYSTRKIDKTAKNILIELKSLMSDRKIKDEVIRMINDWPSVYIMYFVDLTITDVMRRFDFNELLSDPRMPIIQRWGIKTKSEKQKTFLMGASLFGVWKFRAQIAKIGSTYCYNESKPQGDCDSNSLDYKKLETSFLDSGLVAGQKVFFAQFLKHNESDRLDLARNLSLVDGYFEYCGTFNRERCTAFDYLLGEPERLERMSANPNDSMEERMGIPKRD